MNNDDMVKFILRIWNNSFIYSEQVIEFKSKKERDVLLSNLKIFDDLVLIADWYDLGFFKLKPIYIIKIERLK